MFHPKTLYNSKYIYIYIWLWWHLYSSGNILISKIRNERNELFPALFRKNCETSTINTDALPSMNNVTLFIWSVNLTWHQSGSWIRTICQHYFDFSNVACSLSILYVWAGSESETGPCLGTCFNQACIIYDKFPFYLNLNICLNNYTPYKCP